MEFVATNEEEAKKLASGAGLVFGVNDLGGWINPSQAWLGLEESAVYLGVKPGVIWEMVQMELLPKPTEKGMRYTREMLDKAFLRKKGISEAEQQEIFSRKAA
jgi:hypothetical protein